MITKISQQNKIDWFASFYSLDFDLNDSLQFGPEKYRDFRETYRSQSPKQIRGKDSLPLSPERMGCQSIAGLPTNGTQLREKEEQSFLYRPKTDGQLGFRS